MVTYDLAFARLLRDRFGIGIQQVKDVMAVYEKDPDSGIVFAVCVTEAQKLALSAGERDLREAAPAVLDSWCRQYAPAMVKMMIEEDPTLADLRHPSDSTLPGG
jgi:hypothetical protein